MDILAIFVALLSLHCHLTLIAAASVPSLPRDAEKPVLRLMPLGASITQGYDNNIPEHLRNGYRKPLREQLVNWSYHVDMIGSRINGDFDDRHHEGWSGYEISGLTDKMLPAMTSDKPNLVLILLGSNDCFRARRKGDIDYAYSAKDRMWSLVQKAYSLSPGVTVILATLPATTDPGDEPYIQAANAGYRSMVEELQAQGQKIELAEMYTSRLQAGDHSDPIHFNDAGYAKIAAIFAEAFQRVEAKKWIVAPVNDGEAPKQGCLPSPDGFRGPIRTQQGYGYDDQDGMMYCDMYGRGHDDYLWVSTDGNVHLFENTLNPPTWANHGRILETNFDRKAIYLADWDADGLCDVLIVDRPTGDMTMFRNAYKKGAEVPTFEPPVQVLVSALCPQFDVELDIHDRAVRFGDLDGDGRVDYICMDPDGRSRAWFNKADQLHTAPSTIPNQIKISEGFQRHEHHWEDVNGDGKVDLLAIYHDSKIVQVWINAGIEPTSSSGMKWERKDGIWMQGVDSGANVYFPRLSKSKRADYHVFNPQTNEADTWFNEGKCGGQ